MKRRGAIILTALALSLTLLSGCAAWYGYNVPDTAVGEHGVMTGVLADKLEEPLYFVLLNHEDNRWHLFKLGYDGGPYDLDDFEIGDELYAVYRILYGGERRHTMERLRENNASGRI